MELKERINAFVQLGKVLSELKNITQNSEKKILDFTKTIQSARSGNEWFTLDNLNFALNSLAENLTKDSIEKWISNYPTINNQNKRKIVGLIMAGNIPLVGFHDFLCVLMVGHEVVIKPSSKDDKLMKGVVELLKNINPEFEQLITFENNQLKRFDAIIATGSNNSAKYFEYYFGKYPHIIRKNRNSLAVLTGNETTENLDFLADDMLIYFGLGCRNVSKVFIPENFDIDKLFEAVYKYNDYANHNKFANNYMYNKSIYLMNKSPFLENGFLIMKEDSALISPISVIYIERYHDIEEVKFFIDTNKEQIQCVVAQNGVIQHSVSFGESQKPKLWDYADNVDTLEFLLSI